MNKITDFPQYRRLSNGQHYYRIISHDAFEELQVMGTRVLKFSIKAIQYPEKLRIMDMLNCVEGFEIIDSKEFENLDEMS